jgi:hypothetical protein
MRLEAREGIGLPRCVQLRQLERTMTGAFSFIDTTRPDRDIQTERGE